MRRNSHLVAVGSAQSGRSSEDLGDKSNDRGRGLRTLRRPVRVHLGPEETNNRPQQKKIWVSKKRASAAGGEKKRVSLKVPLKEKGRFLRGIKKAQKRTRRKEDCKS